ncbi:MAG: recombinase family protein [Bacteroides sp.]|nr:recombinase family protein [Eubacterium sp.]MCM1419728.1 recombinase family protein [Roseburia sp.]MCM1463703.1 recombinase family protein [Bacteroides sp.]
MLDNSKKAVVYARYSCDKQTEQSIEGQLRVISDFAAREGYTIVGEYIDRAKSAKTANRPEFLRMISDSARGGFQFVIVYKLDRFARNRYDSAFYKDKLRKNGVRVISATEELSDNPESIITEAILEAMAEFYSAELGQKTRRGMRESALKCQTTGAYPPLGYKWGEDKKLCIDEATAEIPRIAFSMYANGMGKTKIANALNERGFRTRYGKEFKAGSLDLLLQNKKYIGVYTYSDIEIEGGCPALIDRETFHKVQELLAQTKKAPARARAKTEYLLARRLFCGKCGEPMVAVGGTSRNGEQHHYYRCKCYKECGKKAERKSFIEWFVTEQITELLNFPERREIFADKVIAAYRSSMETDRVEELEREIAAVNAKLNHVIDLLIERKTDALLQKMDDLELQKSELEEALNSARLAAKHIPTRAEIMEWFARFNAADETSANLQKQVISTFVHKVFLWDDKALIVLTLNNTSETVTFDQIREWETMVEETDEPPSECTESGSCKNELGSPYWT